MAYITSISIDGFWENHKIGAKFKKDVNFVVGVNGSGKTTFINLVAAALTGNIDDLAKIAFHKIKINISDSNTAPLLLEASKDKAALHITLSRKQEKLVEAEFAADFLERQIIHSRRPYRIIRHPIPIM